MAEPKPALMPLEMPSQISLLLLFFKFWDSMLLQIAWSSFLMRTNSKYNFFSIFSPLCYYDIENSFQGSYNLSTSILDSRVRKKGEDNMKLNPNCVRDILISVEDNTGYDIYLDYPADLNQCPNLSSYSDDEIRYHIFQCEKSGLIEINLLDMEGNIQINDLTPKGHSFLADIRSDTVWKDVKAVSSKVGSTSLSALIQIANGVITALIKSQLNI